MRKITRYTAPMLIGFMTGKYVTGACFAAFSLHWAAGVVVTAVSIGVIFVVLDFIRDAI